MFLPHCIKNRSLTTNVRMILGNKGRTDWKNTSLFSTWNSAQITQKQNISKVLNNQVFGQPVASTHPHLINKGYLVPGVKLDEFKQRRAKLLTGVQKYAADHLQNGNRKEHLVIVASSTKKYMSDKIPYFYRQNSDFYYLSGCLEPDSVLVMSINENGNMKSVMFVRPKDKHAELWEGSRTGVDLAIELFGLDDAYPCGAFEQEIKRKIEYDKPVIWYDMNSSDLRNVTEEFVKIVGSETRIESPTTVIQGMRLFKSPAEQNLMRQTCEIASTSINEVMSETRPGHSEHHIYAMIDYKCRMRNASHLAYPPVVATGNNATTIHYINNTQLCRSGDLILMDAGCEYAGYTSDITRTWPVSGEFTKPQKILYDVVLQLQKKLIDKLLKEGGQTLDHLFDTMCIMLGKYLQEVGLVPKHITDVVGLTRAGYQFCPHHVSHYLGMDVHDTPLMPRSLKLLPGMVFTVEPGIYISQDRSDVPKEFRGIGIRIEDDILITNDNKVEVLTATCSKNRNVLENLHKKKICN